MHKTALTSAAENNQLEMVRWLICNGADVNLADKVSNNSNNNNI